MGKYKVLEALGINIVKGKLKEVTAKWQEPLVGENLLLITGVGETWVLLSVERDGKFGDEELLQLAKCVWDKGFVDDYENYEDFIEDLKLGNIGFAFEHDEIEVLEEIV